MPIANVIRIMRRILPPHSKISDDAKETMQECVSEYIAFITGEANERCQREQRKTVTAEDVLWAMGKLGFDNYVEPLTIYLQRYRESESSDRSQFVKREELQLMEYYPPGHAGQVAMMPPSPPSYGPGYYFGPQHGPPMYDPSMMGMFRDGSSGAGGGGSSSASGAHGENSLGGFDPFGHFK
ncbi:transcriptional activator hap3-like [Pyrus communis]|uniref:transcriptional activator hap3-like n=1 Tax=Pyrus communis TaxID=23211 RepID=UPI0035C05265